jgi:MoaA/NifB/PqqE/SkfB family radical SAM enzyme
MVGYASILRGWDINAKDYELAHERKSLVKLIIETSNVCNLACDGCFTNRMPGTWDANAKRRLDGEMIEYHALIRQGLELGARTIDVVGAGEPFLAHHLSTIEEYRRRVGKHVAHLVIASHGGEGVLDYEFSRRKDYGFNPTFSHNSDGDLKSDISLIIKLWSLDPARQDDYVRKQGYAAQRDRTVTTLIENRWTRGRLVEVDGRKRLTTSVGADILVRKSNYQEIPPIFRFCRDRNIFPLVKTYIPDGPTRFSISGQREAYPAEQLNILREDEVSVDQYMTLRERLQRIDKEEYGIEPVDEFYPQASKCTQSIGSLYVTVRGEIRSCVGTPKIYGHFPETSLTEALRLRDEPVGFGCLPRYEEYHRRGIEMPLPLVQLLTKDARS